MKHFVRFCKQIALLAACGALVDADTIVVEVTGTFNDELWQDTTEGLEYPFPSLFGGSFNGSFSMDSTQHRQTDQQAENSITLCSLEQRNGAKYGLRSHGVFFLLLVGSDFLLHVLNTWKFTFAMKLPFFRECLNAAVILCIAFSSAWAEDDENPDDAEGWREFCKLTAENISIREVTHGIPKTFARHEHPIFEHKNPFGRDERGLVFLWKQENGRPAAVFSSLIIRRSDGSGLWNEIFEYHSLHDAPIIGSFGDQTDIPEKDYRQALAWRPQLPGLEWKEIPGAPAPATTRLQLVRQARKLTERFKCDGRFGRAAELYHFRPLSKPAYDFHFKQDERLFGGILTFFCRATDPEAILALEVQEATSGKLKWFYACANFTRADITFFLDDEEVWNERSYRYPGLFFNPEYRHYGNFPVQRFTIKQAIERQQAQLDRLKRSKDSP